MDEYWDRDDQWADVGRCLVCKDRSSDLYCSATCEDILNLSGQRREPLLDWSEGELDHSWWEAQHNHKIGV